MSQGKEEKHCRADYKQACSVEEKIFSVEFNRFFLRSFDGIFKNRFIFLRFDCARPVWRRQKSCGLWRGHIGYMILIGELCSYSSLCSNIIFGVFVFILVRRCVRFCWILGNLYSSFLISKLCTHINMRHLLFSLFLRRDLLKWQIQIKEIICLTIQLLWHSST